MSRRAVAILAVFSAWTLLSGCVAQPGLSPPPADSSTAPTRAGGSGSWPRWGGPDGDFKVEARGLASHWPLTGPPTIWARGLGAGYSAIAAANEALYTMYRNGDDEVVVALDAGDGTTLWEHRYPAPTREGNQIQFGKGPNSTPLVVGDRLVTLGYTGVLRCVDRRSGQLAWSHELVPEFGGQVLDFGYAASPIAQDGHVIVLVGGDRHGVIAFDPHDGTVVWASPPTSVSYATPVVIDLQGQKQIVYFTADEIVGLQATDGTRVWSFPVVNEYRNNATDPIWSADGVLWVASQLDGGTRALRLTRDGAQTTVEELWRSDRLSIHFWNALRLGDTVYASIGSNASILAAVNMADGEIRWRERGFVQANLVHAGDRTILLDSEGQLALVRLSPEGLTILSQAQITDRKTWIPPTLVGTRLFVRDDRSIRALELKAETQPGATP